MNISALPPISHLDEVKGRSSHLTLAHLCDDPRYIEFYRNESDQGSFVIVDNSAHEFQMGSGPRQLAEVATRLNAREVVLPDYLENSEETVHLTTAALKAALDEDDLFPASVESLMIVPQGQDIWDYLSCFYQLISASREFACGYFYSIGVSKDYDNIFEGGLYRLLERDILPVAEDLNYKVHLLGWSENLWALGDIGRHFGNRIRSIDSARPFVYGLNEISLAWYLDTDPPEYPKRRSDYFQCTMTEDQLIYARKNMEVFDLLAQGKRLGVTRDRVTSHWLLDKEE